VGLLLLVSRTTAYYYTRLDGKFEKGKEEKRGSGKDKKRRISCIGRHGRRPEARKGPGPGAKHNEKGSMEVTRKGRI
jgi:hypothetical protein